jgi:hypothetical protein
MTPLAPNLTKWIDLQRAVIRSGDEGRLNSFQTQLVRRRLFYDASTPCVLERLELALLMTLHWIVTLIVE